MREWVCGWHCQGLLYRIMFYKIIPFVQVWNLKSMECVNTFRVQQEVPVMSVHLLPKSNDQFLICNRSNTISVCNLQGQVCTFVAKYVQFLIHPFKVVRTLSSGKREKGDFLAACVSPKAEWAYCVGEDRVLYCFSMLSGQLESTISVSTHSFHFHG